MGNVLRRALWSGYPTVDAAALSPGDAVVVSVTGTQAAFMSFQQLSGRQQAAVRRFLKPRGWLRQVHDYFLLSWEGSSLHPGVARVSTDGGGNLRLHMPFLVTTHGAPVERDTFNPPLMTDFFYKAGTGAGEVMAGGVYIYLGTAERYEYALEVVRRGSEPRAKAATRRRRRH